MKGKRVNFICFNKAYPIDLPIFNKHSNFFLIEKEIDENEKNIELLSSYDFCTSHTEESIEAFLNYCQDKQIKIKESNVVSIEALSKKYFVEELQKVAEKFIEDHYKEVIEYFLSAKEMKSPKYEELISAHFIEYSNDDRLFILPISTLYRIEQHFIQKMKKEEETNSNQFKIHCRTIINFLLKSVSKIREESCIFISSHKFNQEQIRYLNEQMDNIEDHSTKEILTKFLQSNESFIIEYLKNEKIEKEEEKKKYENHIKRIEDEILFLFCNLDFSKPINIPNSATRIFHKQFEQYPFKEIMLPNNIEIIEDEAFKECSSLIKVTIPTSVTAIGSKSFSGCSSLKEINIPTSVTTIGENIFEGCKELIISKDMTQIPNNLFNKCSSLIKITIPTSITMISEKCFHGCSSLKEVQIPQSVTTICESAFEGCTSLEKITIPSSVKTIESKSFKGCSKLEEIRIDCQTKVHTSSFDNCELLNRLIILTSRISEEVNEDESSIFFKTNIDSTIFNNISNEEQEMILILISNIIINKTKVKEEKIENIVNLIACLKKEKQISRNMQKESFVQIIKNEEQVLIKSKITEILIKNQTFEKEDFLQHVNKFECIFIEVKYRSSVFKTIYNKLLRLKERSIPKLKIAVFITGNDTTDQHFRGNEDISYVILDKCFIKIQCDGHNGSFEDCKSLESILIPSSVTQIGRNAFCSCSSLAQITIPSSVTQIDGGAFSNCSSLAKISIPSSVKKIEGSAFSYCTSLTQITIPTSVTQIEDSAFFHCSSLAQITIPSSLTQIEQRVFSECSSLTQITIPSSVTQIGDSAFCSCSSLIEIIIPSSVTKIGDGAFSYCSSLTKISIPSSVNRIENSAFSYCSSLTQITIPSSITRIEDSVFSYCSSLTQITIPTSIRKIGTSAFCSCSSLTQIIIPSSVTQIGDSAFCSCSSLTQITIPSSITKIKYSTFKSCTSLAQITIPSSVTAIESDAFESCSSLTQITIPSSVTEIGLFAFKSCSSLTQITIPSSVTEIERNAFQSCSSMTQISIPSSIIRMGECTFKSCSSLTQIIIPQDPKSRLKFFKNEMLIYKSTNDGNYDTLLWVKNNIKTINIPSSIKIIEACAFEGCSLLEQIFLFLFISDRNNNSIICNKNRK